MGRVTVGAVFRYRVVFPQEGSAPIGVAGVARLIYAVLDHQLWAVRPVRVVAIGTSHLSREDRVRRDLMNLGALSLMTGEAHFGLSAGREDTIILGMNLVTGSAGHVAALVFATQPIGALAVLVAPDTGIGLYRGRCCRSMAEINVYGRAR